MLERWIVPGLQARSTIDLTAARALAEVFVPTAAYRRALGVLDAHRFAVLTGPPEMGKTSIARMVALALMADGWEAHECTTPEEIFESFREERAQVFVADDAFGSTEYRPDAAERWAREMERLLRMMDDRHWLIWTSRPAPLRADLGRIHRERGAERFPRPGEVLARLHHPQGFSRSPMEVVDRLTDHFLRVTDALNATSSDCSTRSRPLSTRRAG